ncbi:MAG: hypothetical protein LQ337_008773, partial [Flavoplaca oasis]
WGLSTSTSSAPSPKIATADKTTLSTDTATLATTATASFPRLMFPPAPGYDADTEDNNDWMDEHAAMDMQMPSKPSSSVISPVGTNANGGSMNGTSDSDPNPLAPNDAESVADTDNTNANDETITDSTMLSEINSDPTNKPMQTDNDIMAVSSLPTSTSTTPSPSSATPTMPPTPTTPTIQMEKPWKSSIATHNGTAVPHNGMKPSIASISGAWTTPSGAAAAGGNRNGSVAFKGAAPSLGAPFGVYIWGLSASPTRPTLATSNLT